MNRENEFVEVVLASAKDVIGPRPVKIPRVVMEFKQGLSTHDVLTYSAKATRHKQVYMSE